MCVSTFAKVSKIIEKYAIMENGRKVRLGPLIDIRKGDYLEVYADIAISKVSKDIALSNRKVV
jgi:hydrogenase maturation factor